ncbi:porin [Escherichia coli]|uniref:porin n=1 Tax=Escherichia coli TaxID=562 RepID=UPI003B2884EC
MAFGTSLTYDFGGSDFAISGAYTNSDRTNEQNLQSRGTGKRAEAMGNRPEIRCQ